MKIAVTYENGNIFQHFGHTAQFKVYKVSEGKIVSEEILDTNGSGHGALAGLLGQQGINVLICGGIGGGARYALMEAGIDGTVLELKKYEALATVANGRAAKLIIPSDVVDTVKKNVIFSETSGLGDQTVAATDPAPAKKPDPCCD